MASAPLYTSEFLRILHERGFIHQCTDAERLDARLAAGSVTAYIGFDCTAPSLHVGSLIQIMVLRWLQRCGHRPVALLGGGTTRVGDPSGKDQSRRLLSDVEIASHLAGIRKVMERFLVFHESHTAVPALLVDNAEWLDGLGYISFLREVGGHFSVNRMLTQDSVRLRLEREQNLSFLEFNYMVLQSYDFVELHRRYGCALQIGGSDQWGNIVMGIELERRLRAATQQQQEVVPVPPEFLPEVKILEVQPMIRSSGYPPSNYSTEHFMRQMQAGQGEGLYGLTTPLLTTASGQKMGKTEDGAVWLDSAMLSPYAYWQFWRNTEDADVGRFLRLFTELPLPEIARLEALQGAEINEAKKVLANEATRLCHGDRAAKQAAETARQTFEEKGVGEEVPQVVLSAEQVGKGLPAYELFRLSGLVDSGGEARRLIRGGGARINDRKVEDENDLVLPAMFAQGPVKLSAGRKRHAKVMLAPAGT